MLEDSKGATNMNKHKTLGMLLTDLKMQQELMEEAKTMEDLNTRYHYALKVLDIMHSLELITIDEWSKINTIIIRSMSISSLKLGSAQ